MYSLGRTRSPVVVDATAVVGPMRADQAVSGVGSAWIAGIITPRVALFLWSVAPVLLFFQHFWLSHQRDVDLEKRVRQRTDLLHQANQQLNQQLLERTHVENELHQARSHLEAIAATRFAELQDAKAQILHQDRLSVVGKMAASVAHDLMNSVSPILHFSNVLKREGLSRRQTELVGYMERAAKETKNVGQGLKRFYQSSNLASLKIVDLTSMVDEVVVLIRPYMCDSCTKHGVSIEIETEIEPQSTLFANDIQIRQLLTNLVLNAIDAIRTDGVITIQAETSQQGTDLRVSDNGIGMDDQTRRRCFRPFFTQKETGTGLGLGICEGIVQSHGGTISVASQVGVGTTFHVHLPVAGRSESDSRPSAGAENNEALRCLFVDDNEFLRRTFLGLCEPFGVLAITASSAREAIEHLNRENFDLVVSDLNMDGMDGIELVQELRRQGNDTSVVLLSGHLSDSRHRQIDQMPNPPDRVLTKPVTLLEFGELFRHHAQRQNKRLAVPPADLVRALRSFGSPQRS